MRIKNLFVGMLTALLVLMTPITAFAKSSDKVSYMTQEEMESEVWDTLSNSISYMVHYDGSFISSLNTAITYGEYTQFINNYTPINNDVTISTVVNDFSNHFNELYANIEFDQDENGKYYEYNIDKPDERNYWVYNEDTDKFVCTNSDNKVIKTYNRYYLPDEQSADTQQSLNTNDNDTTIESKSVIEAESNINDNDNNGQVVTVPENAVIEDDTTPQETDSTETQSSQSAIWFVLIAGVVITFVCVFAVILKGKDKKE